MARICGRLSESKEPVLPVTEPITPVLGTCDTTDHTTDPHEQRVAGDYLGGCWNWQPITPVGKEREKDVDEPTQLEWDIVHDLQELAPALRELGHAHARLDANARMLIARKIASTIDARDLTIDRLTEALMTIARNPSYSGASHIARAALSHPNPEEKE